MSNADRYCFAWGRTVSALQPQGKKTFLQLTTGRHRPSRRCARGANDTVVVLVDLKRIGLHRNMNVILY